MFQNSTATSKNLVDFHNLPKERKKKKKTF